MIYFLYGTDSYRINEKADEIAKQYQKKYPDLLGFESVDLTEAGAFENLKSFFDNTSMFAQQKLAVAKDVFHSPQFVALANFLKNSHLNQSKENNLILTGIFKDEKEMKKLPKEKNDLFNFLLKNTTKSQKFMPFENFSEALPWLKKQIKEHQINIDLPALKILFDNFGQDPYQLINELIKTSLFQPNEKITVKEVNLLAHFPLHPDFFAIFRNFFEGNKKQMLFNLEKSLKAGIDEGEIFNYFIKQVRAALYLLNHQTKYIDLPPFAINKIKRDLARWPNAQQKLTKVYDQLSKIDRLVKRGLIDYQTALEILIAQLKFI